MGGWLELTTEERRFLDGLESRSVSFRRRAMLANEGDEVESAYVVKQGWVATSTDLADGSRQLRRLHVPADIAGMPGLAMRHHAENIVALTDVVVSPFGKDAVRSLFASFPRLSAMMFAISQIERVSLGDRLSCVGRLSAKARIAFVLLDILHRLRGVDRSIGSTFVLHITREEMADITGITPIHVSRKWSELAREGLVARAGQQVTLLDEARLLSLSGYVNRMGDLDLSCLP
ncbi:MAG: Crp/Fnr family transcriptional regulator [Sphingomonadales bacterium]